jgi:hypothetical protein
MNIRQTPIETKYGRFANEIRLLATSIVSTLFPFALFHPRELSALFASTAYNGRAQDNLRVTATAQDRPVPHA